jgi:1,4-dihydroxy-2-naphthoate octaprenyltransferase
MDKEDIDKNLEYFLYVLLGILGGLASIIVAGLIAYAIGYKRLGRLLAGLIIGRLIYSAIIASVLSNSSPIAYLEVSAIIGVIALGMAYKIHKDRSKDNPTNG